MTCGHSMGSSGGPAISITAGTGGVGTGSTGANGGSITFTAGAGGLGSATGGGGGNMVFNGSVGGNSSTPGAGGFLQFFTAATTTLTEKLRITAAGLFIISNSQLEVATAGFGLSVKSGSNCKMGTATLAAGTVTVSNTSVTSNSLIYVTSQADGGTPGFVRVTAKVASTSFTITSSSGSDTSTVAWLIVEEM